MNDVSSLAITEKKPQRPGGCVGIFFQLFDWNRRLAKKKLFSKKLLPPARAKRASKKFGADDKLPAAAKLQLIADENRGGFPKKSGIDNVDSTLAKNHEMRSPSLVARLMGLESMPAVRRDKPKKALFNEFNVEHGKDNVVDENVRCCEEQFVCDQNDFHLGKGHTKMESRPQKLQKTGLFERRPVTRFGAEALQFRSVLSRSRKHHHHHHPQLASPVKSPKVGKSASRLMGAATKILEPGLNATNRAKCALTYSPSFHATSRDEVMAQGQSFVTMDEETKQTSYYDDTSKQLKGQSSCKSCGNWLDVVDSRSNVEEQVVGVPSSALGLGSAPPLGSGRSRVIPSESALLQEGNEVAFKYQERPYLGAEAKCNRQGRSKASTQMKHAFREYQEQYHSSSHHIRYQNDAAPTTARNTRTKRQIQMLPKDRGSVRPKLNNMNSRRDPFAVKSVDGTKDFVAANRNSTSCTKASMSSKVSNNCKVNQERDSLDKKDDSSVRMRGSIRKKRPMNGTPQVEDASSNHSTFRKQRDVRNDVVVGRLAGSNVSSKNQNHIKSKLPIEAKGDAADSGKDIGVVSFTFSSPMRNNAESMSPNIKMEKTRGHGELTSRNSSPKKKLTLDTNTKKPSHVATHLRGDALGALLEEKLKELTCRDRDELETGDDPPGRSTAAILEELILALTAERPVSLEDEDNCSIVLSQDDSSSYASQDPSNDMNSHCPTLTINRKVQMESKSNVVFAGFPLGRDGERHSPGSVLDASFSNDSCFSDSIDGSSGHKLHSESMERSYNQPQPSEYDAELSDCATSTTTVRATIDRVTDSFDNTHSLSYNSSDHDDIGVVGNKLDYASEVIANADLLLGCLWDVSSVGEFSIDPLLDKLEALPKATLTSPDFRMGWSKDGYQQRRFMLDCLVEFLDSKYSVYFKSRFRARPALPLQTNGDSLTTEVHEEIQRWADLAGKSSEDILEREMNTNSSLGNWMDFEMEAFEMGERIESDILQVLVNEVVIDLEQCNYSMILTSC